jgi:uncharacterized Zn-finger protein
MAAPPEELPKPNHETRVSGDLSIVFSTVSSGGKAPSLTSGSGEIFFNTDINALIKEMQDKSQIIHALQESPDQNDSKKRFQCQVTGCMRSFDCESDLVIHDRSHTGIKPYVSISVICRQLS